MDSILSLPDLPSLFSSLDSVAWEKRVDVRNQACRSTPTGVPQTSINDEQRPQLLDSYSALWKISVNVSFSSHPQTSRIHNIIGGSSNTIAIRPEWVKHRVWTSTCIPSRQPHGFPSGLIAVETEACCNPKPSYSLASFKCINTIWEKRCYLFSWL